jgi:hypothetical protein
MPKVNVITWSDINQLRVYKFSLLYCDVLPGNASNNLWILDFMLCLLDKSSGGITVNYYTLNIIGNTLR